MLSSISTTFFVAYKDNKCYTFKSNLLLWGDYMKDILLDTVLDSLKLIPFLFVAFLIIEFIEHKLSNKNKQIISKAGKYGPLIGSLLGAVPQCGFSVMATNLYAIRIISLGTLISIYLSTSDEMIPILLSHRVDISLIIQILLLKVVIGMFCGFVIDFLLRKKKTNEKVSMNYEICDDEHCDCKNGIFKSTCKHTLLTTLFIFLVSLTLNIIMEMIGTGVLSHLFLKNSIFGSLITSLIGLIPNCAASVIITELYLQEAISFGAMIGGLLTGSGVGLLVLFKVNKNVKDNFKIVGIVYLLGVISGIIIDIIGLL